MKKATKTLIFTLGLFGAPFSLAADDDYFRCLRDANERAITRWQLEHLQNLCGHKYPPLDILRESKRMLDESRKPENQVMGMCQSIVGGKPYGNPSLATKGRCEFLGNRWTPKNKDAFPKCTDILAGRVTARHGSSCRSSGGGLETVGPNLWRDNARSLHGRLANEPYDPSNPDQVRERIEAVCREDQGNQWKRCFSEMWAIEKKTLQDRSDLKRRQDLAEQVLKDFCAANPGDCADDDAAQKVCGSSSQGWRSGDAWSACLQRERAKAKTRRLKK